MISNGKNKMNGNGNEGDGNEGDKNVVLTSMVSIPLDSDEGRSHDTTNDLSNGNNGRLYHAESNLKENDGIPPVRYKQNGRNYTKDDNGDDSEDINMDNNNNNGSETGSSCCCFGKAQQPDKDQEDVDERVGTFEIFKFATRLDQVLMLIGVIAAAVLGSAIPINLAVFGNVITTFTQFNDTDGLNGTNNASNEDIMEEVLPLIYAFLGVGIGAFISGTICIFCFQLAAERQVSRIRVKFFNAVIKQNIGWFDLHDSGEIGSHFSEDITKIGEGIGDKMCVFIQWSFTFVGAHIMAFTQSWRLTLCVVIISPLIVLLGGKLLKVMRNFSSKELKAYAKAGSIAEQALRAIRTVQAFQGQEKEVERYNSSLTDAVRVASKKGIVVGIGQSTLWFVFFNLFAMIVWLGIVFVQELDIPPGSIISVFLGVLIGSVSLGNASNNFGNISLARAAASKVFSVIALKSKVDATSDIGIKPEKLDGHIKLENIHFSYPARTESKILNGFNLEIEPGQHIALVGSSGCGKSTVVQLIQRFYDPFAGEITIDGLDLKKINLKWLRQQIGIVSQEPVLFDMTISENIRFGKLDATTEEIEQAAKDANAHDFIKLLPQGYETNIGERGAQLSGGQKQRIAIARALIRNPSILLLDEATSALDQESEAVVQNALTKAEKGRTTITIAHRLSTIRNADKIVSISEGEVMEMGTHAQLMEAKGLYYELVQIQTKLEKDGQVDIKDVEIVEDDDEINSSTKEELLRSSFRRSGESLKSNHLLPKQVSLIVRSSERRANIKEEKNLKKELVEEEEVPEVALKTIMSYNSPEWFLILAGCLSSLLSGCIHPAFSFLISEYIKIFGIEDNEKQMNETHVLALIVIGMAFLSAIIRMLQGYCFCKSGAILTARLRSLTFESLVNQDMTYFDHPRNQVSTLTTKLSSDAALVQGATGSKIGQVLEAMSCLVCALVISFAYGWKLAFVVSAFLPFMILAGIVQGYVIKGSAKKENNQLQEAGKICAEVLDNIRTVVSLGREEYFFSKFEMLINSNKKSIFRTSLIFGICYGTANSLLYFAYAVAFYYGSILVEDGEMEFFDVFRVFAAIVFGGTMVGRETSFGVDYSKAKLAASRIIQLINRKPTVDVRINAGKKLTDYKGNLSLQEAVFHYPTRPTAPVLNGLSLSIQAGETVALVGSSGCGKSTLTQIIQRYYDLDAGSLLADSVNIKDVNLVWFRQQISIVSQEPTLFDCSIAENIAYGDNMRDVPMHEIIEAAQNANIHSFISSLPRGYETNVGNKGAQLSGGQKQRIAIARALIRNPKVLLLDEATSALDSESEKTVQDALEKAGVNRTCITIAHRLSTIQNADKIAVVNKGKIVEIGSFNKLLTIKGAFYRLYSAQNHLITNNQTE